MLQKQETFSTKLFKAREITHTSKESKGQQQEVTAESAFVPILKVDRATTKSGNTLTTELLDDKMDAITGVAVHKSHNATYMSKPKAAPQTERQLNSILNGQKTANIKKPSMMSSQMTQWKTSVWMVKVYIKVNASILQPSQIAKLFDVKACKPQSTGVQD